MNTAVKKKHQWHNNNGINLIGQKCNFGKQKIKNNAFF